MSGSVGQPNFDDLYKFLVSFGLTAIIGAGAIPWLLQQGSEDLLVSEAKSFQVANASDSPWPEQS